MSRVPNTDSDTDSAPPSILDPAPQGLGPLERAYLLTERAATVGFDWPRIEDVLDKVDEEVQELRAAVAAGRRDEARAELGDSLFALANAARFLDVSPAAALTGALDRFVARFRWMEARLRETGEPPESVGLARLDALWNGAKRAGVGVATGADSAAVDGTGDR